MRIAAIVPLYNGARYITEALDSVFAQTRLPDEFIVVDDGSTDAGEGARIVTSMNGPVPVRLLRKENGGQSVSSKLWRGSHQTAS